ncbi:MAG: BrnT family toxin [Candidatus Omnitrophica bacterium]|nr:BrnT family toxin [Candidatus Omnitrophota bacterium]
MREIRFAWNEGKNRVNQRKHGVSFEEARSVFYDERAIEFPDPEHSQQEDRFLLLGLSGRLRVLLVCHCFREDDEVIRILSVRKATKKEFDYYERGTL